MWSWVDFEKVWKLCLLTWTGNENWNSVENEIMHVKITVAMANIIIYLNVQPRAQKNKLRNLYILVSC